DGTEYEVEIKANIVRDPLTGKPVIMGITRDISSQVHAQQTQRRLASILEQTPDAALVTDLGGMVIEWNKGAEQLFGYTAQQAMGKFGFLMEPGDDPEGSVERRKTLLGGKDMARYETARKRKDGTPLHLSVSASVLKDHTGKPVGYAAIYHDITEDRKVQENQRLLVMVMEQSPDAIVAADAEQRIIQWNKGAEKMFGWSAEEVVGRKLGFFVPPELAEEGDQARQALLRGGRETARETIRLTKDGRRFPVSVSAGPLLDPSGKVVGASAIFRDIAEQKKGQETQRLLANILERTPD